MRAITILLELNQRGIEVDLLGDRIRCRHAPGVLTPELAARVRAHRHEVVELLAEPERLRLAAAQGIFGAREDTFDPDTSEGPPGVVRCWACGTERTDSLMPCSRCHPPARRSGLEDHR